MKHPEWSLGTTYKFSDHGFDAEDERCQTHTDWAQVLDAHETASYFLLYVPGATHILAKRFLNNTNESAVLRDLIRTHVKKAKLRG